VLAMVGDADITPEQAEALRREHDAQLIDVREEYEWDAGRIEGARHIVLGEVAAQASTIDQERPVVFYCRVGSRSAMAADAFRRAGYEAYSLDGGLAAWAGGGRPLEPEDGSVASH
jgi:rhodanese-related sulfurtransferase